MLTSMCLKLSAPLMLAAATTDTSGPRYTAEGALIPPVEYREWVFLSSGLDMSYTEDPAMKGHSMFDNVFVDPTSWSAFAGNGSDPATQLPFSAPCYSCHQAHGAVDTTFTQFYPTAKTIAVKAGTYHEPR